MKIMLYFFLCSVYRVATGFLTQVFNRIILLTRMMNMTMKKLFILFSAVTLLSTSVNAWEGDYELDNGAKITRKPSGVQYGGMYGAKGIFINDISLSPDLNPTQFRQEVSKLGKIKKETINPPEASAPVVAPTSAPVANAKSTSLTRARALRGTNRKTTPAVSAAPVAKAGSKAAPARGTKTRTLRGTKAKVHSVKKSTRVTKARTLRGSRTKRTRK